MAKVSDTASLFEAAGKRGALDPAIKPIWSGARCQGFARTATVPRGENLSLHQILPDLKPDDVLVVDAQGAIDIAIWGEVMAVAAQARGCAGLVVDGAVRDVAAMADRGFPVFARGVAIPGPLKEKLGQIDVPNRVGGIAIAPGDWVVADGDGVVSIPSKEIEDVRKLALERERREEALMHELAKGATTTLEAMRLAPA